MAKESRADKVNLLLSTLTARDQELEILRKEHRALRQEIDVLQGVIAALRQEIDVLRGVIAAMVDQVIASAQRPTWLGSQWLPGRGGPTKKEG